MDIKCNMSIPFKRYNINALDVSASDIKALIHYVSNKCALSLINKTITIVGKSIDNMVFFKINNTYVGSLYFNNKDQILNFELSDLTQLDVVYTYDLPYHEEIKDHAQNFLHWKCQ